MEFAQWLEDSALGRESGWFLDSEDGRLAILDEVKPEDMFWESYRITIVPEAGLSHSIAESSFWNSEFFHRATWFENRQVPYRVDKALAVMGGNGRLFVRGLYVPSNVIPRWVWLTRPVWRLVWGQWSARKPYQGSS